MYIWEFLKFLVIFCRLLIKHCCHAKTEHLISQQSLASIINKPQFFLTKQYPVYWGIYIPSDMRSRSEQSHHPPGALLVSNHR